MLSEPNMPLIRTFWIAPCLDCQILIQKWKNRTETLMSWCLFLLEHSHWVANDNLRCYWPVDLTGFDLDDDLFHRVHPAGILWAVLVHTPCFHHLLYRSDYPRGRVSPYSAQCVRFYLCEPQDSPRKSSGWKKVTHRTNGHIERMKKHCHCGEHVVNNTENKQHGWSSATFICPSYFC